jgi:hypothetical protein
MKLRKHQSLSLPFACILSLCNFLSIAQNKTLGVGVTTPNPNATLHVESATGNQGFIMPRLTSIQRTAMAAIPLTGADDGLLVYDKDLKQIFVWDGAVWQLTAKSNAKYLIADPASKDSALTAKTYSNQSHAFAVSGIHKGTGDAAGFFLVDNPASGAPALYGESRGTGTAVMGNVGGGGSGNAGYFMNSMLANPKPALVATTNSNVTNAHALYAESNGKSNSAGSFINLNVANTDAAVYAETHGTGPSLFTQASTGIAAFFNNFNAGSTNDVVMVQHMGGGIGINLNLSNPANVQHAININHLGTGKAISANRLIESSVPTSTTSAGNFSISNAASNAPALLASTTGIGYALRSTNSGMGSSAKIENNNASNTNLVLDVSTNGLGAAGNFVVNNGASTGAAVAANTTGMGTAVYATNTGTGPAAQFIATNSSTFAVAIESDLATAPALTLQNTGAGAALEVTGGGIRYNVIDVTSAGSIAVRSTVYNIAVTGTFTFSWPPSSGDIIYVFNSNGPSVTVESNLISGSSMVMMMYVAGGWRVH